MNQLYGCIVIAHFAAQTMLRLRPHLDAGPVVIMQGVRPHEAVYSTNARARALGLREGMSRLEVETFGAIEILHRSVLEEQTAQGILLEAMSFFSPSVECLTSSLAGPHWECFADLAGTERVLGKPFLLGRKIVEHLRLLGFAAHVALCGNADAARSLARHAAHQQHGSVLVQVVGEAAQASALASLPLHVLGLDEDTRERFAAWGITTLGELAALPEIDLITRMGQAGKRLRLRARGELPHLLQPVTEVFRLEETTELDHAIETLEPLLFVLNPMLGQLILRVQSRALALASVTLSLKLEHPADRMLDDPALSEDAEVSKPFQRTIQPAIATLDRALLLKMLQLDLEAHPPPGAVIRLQLNAAPGDTSRIQLGLFAPPSPEPTRFEDTHARLVALVGESNVGRVRPTDTHAPDAFALERFRLPGPITKVSPPRPQGSLPATSLRRIRPPAELRVILRERHIFSFIFEARRYEVLRCYGPWRSSGDWWRSEVWSFDAWDLAARATNSDDDRGELLICMIGHDLLRDRWQMEGVYD